MKRRGAFRAQICTLLLAGIAAAPVGAAEDIYRWVDGAGVVHYTQVAPRGVAYERVSPGARRTGAAPSFYNPTPDGADAPAGSTAPAPSQDTAAAPEGQPTLTPEQQARRDALEAEANARLANVRDTREENCRNAREQFQQFTTYARIRVADGDGGTRVLTESEREARIAEAQEAIVLNCDDAG